MITTNSPPIFLTARLLSPVVPSSYVFIMTVDVEMLLVEYRMIATTEGLLLIYHDMSLKLVYDVCCISAIGTCDRTDESASVRTKGGRSEQAVVFFRQCPWLAGPFPLSLLQWFICHVIMMISALHNVIRTRPFVRPAVLYAAFVSCPKVKNHVTELMNQLV